MVTFYPFRRFNPSPIVTINIHIIETSATPREQDANENETDRKVYGRRGKMLEGGGSIYRAHTKSGTNIWQSAVYGKCIVADYNNVQKDKCAAEFMKLQQCYTVSLTHE